MKKVTLHKSNELTRCGDNLSLHAKRAINAIYYAIQHNVNRGKKDLVNKLEYIELDFSYLRKMMSLEKTESYIREIEDALIELQVSRIELHNFRNPRDNEVYNWFSISFLSDARWKVKNNKKIAQIALSPFIKWLMINTKGNGNFTKFELIPTLNKLRTKYSLKLYEYLKSFDNYRYLNIRQLYLLKLLGLEENHKTYKHYAKLKNLLERQLKEIQNKTDLKEVKLYEDPKKELSRQKIYRIIINPKVTKRINTEESAKRVEEFTKNFFTRL